jgi:hypothetical protein
MGLKPITHTGTITLTTRFPHRSHIKEIKGADASRTAHWPGWTVDTIESSPVKSNRRDELRTKAHAQLHSGVGGQCYKPEVPGSIPYEVIFLNLPNLFESTRPCVRSWV